jgi:hypothetical protein
MSNLEPIVKEKAMLVFFFCCCRAFTSSTWAKLHQMFAALVADPLLAKHRNALAELWELIVEAHADAGKQSVQTEKEGL